MRNQERIWGRRIPRASTRGQQDNALRPSTIVKLHNPGRLSPVRSPRRNFNQVHFSNPRCGDDRSSDKARNPNVKKGVDWTSIHETNRWRSNFQSDSDGDIEDQHLFTGADSSTLMGRPTSPGPPPYRAAKNVRDDVPQRHEDSANSKSNTSTTGTNHRSASRSPLPEGCQESH